MIYTSRYVVLAVIRPTYGARPSPNNNRQQAGSRQLSDREATREPVTASQVRHPPPPSPRNCIPRTREKHNSRKSGPPSKTKNQKPKPKTKNKNQPFLILLRHDPVHSLAKGYMGLRAWLRACGSCAWENREKNREAREGQGVRPRVTPSSRSAVVISLSIVPGGSSQIPTSLMTAS
ncbi:hypothetical protein VTN02DRAFT_1455 [Thermoascus thermophilus]